MERTLCKANIRNESKPPTFSQAMPRLIKATGFFFSLSFSHVHLLDQSKTLLFFPHPKLKPTVLQSTFAPSCLEVVWNRWQTPSQTFNDLLFRLLYRDAMSLLEFLALTPFFFFKSDMCVHTALKKVRLAALSLQLSWISFTWEDTKLKWSQMSTVYSSL